MSSGQLLRMNEYDRGLLRNFMHKKHNNSQHQQVCQRALSALVTGIGHKLECQERTGATICRRLDLVTMSTQRA